MSRWTVEQLEAMIALIDGVDAWLCDCPQYSELRLFLRDKKYNYEKQRDEQMARGSGK